MTKRLSVRALQSTLFGLKLVGSFGVFGVIVALLSGGLDAVGRYFEEYWLRALVGVGLSAAAHFVIVLLLVPPESDKSKP